MELKKDTVVGNVVGRQKFDHEEARYTHPREWYQVIEEHTADSKWQYCMCRSCQDRRETIEKIPGPPINWDTLRLKDERY
jgi:hypothetical protein